MSRMSRCDYSRVAFTYTDAVISKPHRLQRTCQFVERQVERFQGRALAEPLRHFRQFTVGRGQMLKLRQAANGGWQ